jgi:Protein of unknown function (DUF4019)
MCRFIRLLLLAALVAGCTASTRVEDVEKEITKFHQLLDDGQFETIWFQGSTEFHKAVPREEFVTFLAAVHRKLGQVQTSSRQTWRVEYTGRGTLVVLSYKTRFTEGDADEQFVYQNDGALAQLVRYDISSLVLVLK